jgi:AraC family transcriptional regulator
MDGFFSGEGADSDGGCPTRTEGGGYLEPSRPRRRRADATEPTPARGGLAPHRLKRVLELIEAGLADALSLEQLSREAGLNPSHFSRAFKQSMGVPPHRHLVGRRIERAREMLERTDLPILQVALEVGYGSQSHFTTVFRRMIGQTPWRYRSRRRN